jgi:hypothetical protein
MSKLEIDMEKIKESIKREPEPLKIETKKLKVTNVQTVRINNRSVFAFLLVDHEKNLYEFRMTSDLVYEDQIKKILSRMRAVELLSKIIENNLQEGKKDGTPPVEETKSQGQREDIQNVGGGQTIPENPSGKV